MRTKHILDIRDASHYARTNHQQLARDIMRMEGFKNVECMFRDYMTV